MLGQRDSQGRAEGRAGFEQSGPWGWHRRCTSRGESVAHLGTGGAGLGERSIGRRASPPTKEEGVGLAEC